MHEHLVSDTPGIGAPGGGDKATNSPELRLFYKCLTNAGHKLLISLISMVVTQDRRCFFAFVSGAFALPPAPQHALKWDRIIMLF